MGLARSEAGGLVGVQALAAGDPAEVGGYRLAGRLGSGGMGVVYLAFTPGGGRWR